MVCVVIRPLRSVVVRASSTAYRPLMNSRSARWRRAKQEIELAVAGAAAGAARRLWTRRAGAPRRVLPPWQFAPIVYSEVRQRLSRAAFEWRQEGEQRLAMLGEACKLPLYAS